jgi:hypothetical protein
MFGRETPPVVIGDWLQRVERTGSVYYYGVYDNLVAWMPAGGGHGISWAAITSAWNSAVRQALHEQTGQY